MSRAPLRERAKRKPPAFASLVPAGIAPAMPHALYKVDGTLATHDEIRAAAMLVSLRDMGSAPMMNAPAATRAFLVARLRDMPREIFSVLLLDNRHRLIEYKELFHGTIDGCSVHPRDVVREALRANAAAVIFAHNHPSGVADASQADELITRRLKDALALVDVRVLDHFIVGAGTVLSFAERGLL